MLRENAHDPEIEYHGNKRMDIPSLPDIPAEVEGLLGRVLMVLGSSHTSKNKVIGSLGMWEDRKKDIYTLKVISHHTLRSTIT